MKISVKAFLWAAFCLLTCAGQAHAQGEWKMNGWMAQSFTANPDAPVDRWNGPVTWTDRSNEYQLNELNMYLERTTDTGGNGWDLGMRVEGMYGTSSRFTNQTGLELNSDFTQNWNGNNRFYGFSLWQFYSEIAYNDLKIKVGRFVSPVGYFTVGSPNNFFNTIPYTYQYGEPFTHTGALATYTMTDNLTVGGGIIKGWDNFDNSFNPHIGQLITSTYTFDDGSSYAYVGVLSQEPAAAANAGGFAFRYFQTQVYSKPITDTLTWVLQSDYGVQNNALANGSPAKWYGANTYLLKTINDKWSFGFNFEWFRDQEGFRTVQVGVPNKNGSERTPPLNGYAGNFYQITVGPRWKPTENLMIRPNVRWDWYNGDLGAAPTVGGVVRPLPFDDGNSGTQCLFVTDIVLSF